MWERGGLNDPPMLDLETWVIAAGSAGVSVHTIRQPGAYVYLSHNLIEAFMYDTKAILEAEGEWNNDLMEQVRSRRPPQRSPRQGQLSSRLKPSHRRQVQAM